MSGIELIAAERRRQIEEEGWTPEHDVQHEHNEPSQAAAYYCLPEDDADLLFPEKWAAEWMKREGFPVPTDRDLIKAGALIAAELDRRAALRRGKEGGES